LPVQTSEVQESAQFGQPSIADAIEIRGSNIDRIAGSGMGPEEVPSAGSALLVREQRLDGPMVARELFGMTVRAPFRYSSRISSLSATSSLASASPSIATAVLAAAAVVALGAVLASGGSRRRSRRRW
jgi:hypothetical protein